VFDGYDIVVRSVYKDLTVHISDYVGDLIVS
jgi:hypothetical protein